MFRLTPRSERGPERIHRAGSRRKQGVAREGGRVAGGTHTRSCTKKGHNQEMHKTDRFTTANNVGSPLTRFCPAEGPSSEQTVASSHRTTESWSYLKRVDRVLVLLGARWKRPTAIFRASPNVVKCVSLFLPSNAARAGGESPVWGNRPSLPKVRQRPDRRCHRGLGVFYLEILAPRAGGFTPGHRGSEGVPAQEGSVDPQSFLDLW